MYVYNNDLTRIKMLADGATVRKGVLCTFFLNNIADQYGKTRRNGMPCCIALPLIDKLPPT